MITEKKNQHYVPKFYLKNFSFKKNKKQIGVYNIFNKKYILQAKLKTQGSKNFFYGYDGVIEDRLANIEGKLSSVIKSIIYDFNIPKKNSLEHIDLLAFVALTDLRNPVRINGMKNMFKEMEKRILELDSNADISKLLPQLAHEDHIQLSLEQTAEMIKNTLDLEYKLLINKTDNPFITSDFPIVKYNQFLELKKWPQSKTGYGLIGLQIFIPLDHKTTIVLFDSAIYKVGDKKKKTLSITKKEDIDNINILQFINCFGTIFFDEKASEHYIRTLHNKSLKFERANKSQSELSFIIEKEENKKDILKKGKENLMILNSSDCEMNLKITGIKIHSNGKYFKLNSTMSQLRKHPNKIKETKNNSR